MNALTGSRRILSVALLAVLAAALLTPGLKAQERWGEIGLDGMTLNVDGEMVAWPGFALNLGAWRKNYAIEGYALFLYYLPIALGGSVIITPFRVSKVVPYFSAGGLVSLGGDESVTILNSGVGLKIPFSRNFGVRAEYRILYFEDYGHWETAGGVFFGIYASFGHRTGPRSRR